MMHREELEKAMERQSKSDGNSESGEAQQSGAEAGSPSVAFYILYSASIVALVSVFLAGVLH